jgi:DNA-binding transcriptional regulator YiaG
MGEFSVLRPEAQPHPRALAIAFLADTRRALGLSREEFAGRLAAVLQEPVSEAQVREWEESEAAAPPGDVLMAAMLLPAYGQETRLRRWLEPAGS